MATVIGQQGEVRVAKLSQLPRVATKPVAPRSAGAGTIVAHSESGHHHVLTAGTVLEQVENVPAGMRILYAIIENSAELLHEAHGAHQGQALEPGVYEFRISREFDPFAAKARAVSD